MSFYREVKGFVSRLFARKKAGEISISRREIKDAGRIFGNRLRAEDTFAQQFGASFDELFLAAMDRHLERGLENHLPQILWQLAQGDSNVGQAGVEKLVACLTQAGAFWGNAESSGQWAFVATAEANGSTHFDVKVLGGTAQAVGGNAAIFDDLDVSNVADGELFYIRFSLWDNNFEPTCYWYNDRTGAACTIEHGQSLPTSSDNSRFICIVLCKVDKDVPGYIVQYRAGAVDISATLSAGVAGDGITVRSITPPEQEEQQESS